MPSVTHTGFKFIPDNKVMLAGMLIWTLVVSISLFWEIYRINEQTEYFAIENARANWNKDLAFRRWATMHGGLYVRPDDRTPPNPYLAHLPHRDVITTDGMQLTLMNPAYMMRQMTQEYEEMYGVKGKITGQVLLNPINKADPWELEALKRFDQGETEIIEVAQIDDAPYLRLIRPVIMREGCVKCHGHLGFKTGDIRGGVSVSIPLSTYQVAGMKLARAAAITHFIIWLLGLMTFVYITRRNSRFKAERLRHEQSIKDIATGVTTATGDLFFQNLAEHMAAIFRTDYVLISKLDKGNPSQTTTIAALVHGKIVDNISYSVKNSPCHDVLVRNACIYPQHVQQQFPKDKLLIDMAVEGYIGKSLHSSTGKPLGLMVIMDSKPLQHIEEMTDLLEIFAARAAGEIERLDAEHALRRSQKMEAIGQLSGGIAHDFNNQLGVILGYLGFLKSYTADDKKPAAWVETATRATLRCTDLTRQLLSFSRTQTNEKEAVNINIKLKELETVFARSLTPAIDMQYFLSDNIWLTEIDPGDFQDAVLNLIINARDAMPNGGKLLLETSNIYLDEESTTINLNAHAGDYVQLMISDTGTGMDLITQERIFEPFYTTKPKGKGTGLGMSMVYGFVNRFAGFIKIYSEIDVGTTIRIYLPRCVTCKSDDISIQQTEKNQPLPTGSETILIVDDEADLLQLADEYLTALGYQTYLAANTTQALQILADEKQIDLLFTDVVMPGGIDGYELAKKCTRNNTKLKILLTSGFTSKTIAGEDLDRFSANMLSKPYNKADLARHIRHAIDE